MSTGFVRTPPPRQLGSEETLETLTHWRTTFKTFFKRDETYKVFVKEDATWDPSSPNYNQTQEVAGLQRSPGAMMEDLVDLLNILSGFLPHSYLTDKIVRNTKNWRDVWNVIHDHYGVQVTSESLLDFESMHKQTALESSPSLQSLYLTLAKDIRMTKGLGVKDDDVRSHPLFDLK